MKRLLLIIPILLFLSCSGLKEQSDSFSTLVNKVYEINCLSSVEIDDAAACTGCDKTKIFTGLTLTDVVTGHVRELPAPISIAFKDGFVIINGATRSYESFSNASNKAEFLALLNCLSGSNSLLVDINDGNVIATHTSGSGVMTNIEESVTTLIDNGDGTFTHTSEDGTVTVYDETTTSIGIDNVNNQLEFTDEDGVVTELDMCSLVENCETITSMSYDVLTGVLTYINEAGVVNNIDITMTAETITTLVNNGDGSFTYTSEDGTVTNYSETNTSLSLNPNETSIDFIDENGIVNNLDLCAIVNDCETVTSLSFDAINDQLVYVDENGVINNVPLVGFVSVVTDENANTSVQTIATHTSSDGTVVDIEETVTILTNNADGTFTYTSEDGTITNYDETTTVFSLNTDNNSIDYIDEDGVTTTLNICNIVDNCETITSISFDALTNEIVYLDEDGVETRITVLVPETVTSITFDGTSVITYTDENGDDTDIDLANLISQVSDDNDGNIIAVHTSGDGTVANIEETVTTLVDNGDDTFTYTSEDGTVSIVDFSSIDTDTWFISQILEDSIHVVLDKDGIEISRDTARIESQVDLEIDTFTNQWNNDSLVIQYLGEVLIHNNDGVQFGDQEHDCCTGLVSFETFSECTDKTITAFVIEIRSSDGTILETLTEASVGSALQGISFDETLALDGLIVTEDALEQVIEVCFVSFTTSCELANVEECDEFHPTPYASVSASDPNGLGQSDLTWTIKGCDPTNLPPQIGTPIRIEVALENASNVEVLSYVYGDPIGNSTTTVIPTDNSIFNSDFVNTAFILTDGSTLNFEVEAWRDSTGFNGSFGDVILSVWVGGLSGDCPESENPDNFDNICNIHYFVLDNDNNNLDTTIIGDITYFSDFAAPPVSGYPTVGGITEASSAFLFANNTACPAQLPTDGFRRLRYTTPTAATAEVYLDSLCINGVWTDVNPDVQFTTLPANGLITPNDITSAIIATGLLPGVTLDAYAPTSQFYQDGGYNDCATSVDAFSGFHHCENGLDVCGYRLKGATGTTDYAVGTINRAIILE